MEQKQRVNFFYIAFLVPERLHPHHHHCCQVALPKHTNSQSGLRAEHSRAGHLRGIECFVLLVMGLRRQSSHAVLTITTCDLENTRG